MVNKDFKYPIELDHTALKRYSSVQFGLMRALNDIEGEKAGVVYMQERNEERMQSLSKLEYSPLLTADYRALVETVADDLTDRMKRLDKTSAAIETAKAFMNDLLQ